MSDQESFHIRGSEVPYTVEEMDISKLKYFPGNPRVYTALRKISDDHPDQEQIEEVMFKEEHVRKLRSRIESDGGLMEEIIVLRDTMEVVEGNSRLAAYRQLARMSSGMGWDKIKCKVVATLNDRQIRSILAEFHIHGKTEWSTYEQANMFYVEHIKKGVSVHDLNLDTNLSNQKIKKRIGTIGMMEKNDDNNEKHYSHYDVINTNRHLKNALEKNPEFKVRVLREIKNDKIGTAMDVRDKLPDVCENMKLQAFKKFTKGNCNLEDAYDLAVNSGAGDSSMKKLIKFKEWVTNNSVQNNLANQHEIGKVVYETKKILGALQSLRKKIESKGGR